MHPNLLYVVTAVANPLRWKSRPRLFRMFEEHMLESGVNLTVVECAYGERPYECLPSVESDRITHIGVRANNLVWNKECLLNIGISRMSHSARYIAWVDADIFFRSKTWASDTVHLLQLYKMVQPWTTCYDLGPNGEHIQAHTSFCRLFHDGKPIKSGPGYEFPHPGYAWAATRDALEAVGGLIETAALGAADHHMSHSLIGKAAYTFPGSISSAYMRPIYAWQERAQRAICGNIGYLHGTIEHFWHGSKVSRKYIERWEVLTKHDFNPDTDLKRNTYGVLELAGNKPELRLDIDRYMRQRNEDANSM